MKMIRSAAVALLLSGCASPTPQPAKEVPSGLPTITYEPWRPEPLNNAGAWANLAAKEREAHAKLGQIQGQCGDEIYRQNTPCHDVYGATVNLIQSDLDLIASRREPSS